MIYKYEALSITGNEISGWEEGSKEVIKKKLLSKRYQILYLETDYGKTLQSLIERKKIKTSSLAVFFEDTQNMLKTGIGINEVISALTEANTDFVMQKALLQISDSISRGLSLRAAFEKTKVFPWLVLNMLEVGEKSGGLEQICGDLAAFYHKEDEFKNMLKDAMVYPIIVLILITGLLFYISLKIVPQLASLIVTNGKMPLATQIVLSLSAFLRSFWYIVLAMPFAVVFAYTRMQRSKIDKVAGFYYKIPVLGRITKDIALTAVFLNLSILQKNGIGIVDSLDLVQKTLPYEFFSKKILKIKEQILAGFSLWAALKEDSFFVPFIYKTIRKGEEIGRLGEYLFTLSKYFSDKVARQVKMALTFIQPALLLVCAGFVILIIFAFLVPLYSNLNNIAGGTATF